MQPRSSVDIKKKKVIAKDNSTRVRTKRMEGTIIKQEPDHVVSIKKEEEITEHREEHKERKRRGDNEGTDATTEDDMVNGDGDTTVVKQEEDDEVCSSVRVEKEVTTDDKKEECPKEEEKEELEDKEEDDDEEEELEQEEERRNEKELFPDNDDDNIICLDSDYNNNYKKGDDSEDAKEATTTTSSCSKRVRRSCPTIFYQSEHFHNSNNNKRTKIAATAEEEVKEKATITSPLSTKKDNTVIGGTITTPTLTPRTNDGDILSVPPTPTPASASSHRAVTDLACDKIITSFNLQQDVLYDQKFSQMAGPGLGMTRLVSIRGIPVRKWSDKKLRQLCQRLSIPGCFGRKSGKQKLCELIVEQAIWGDPAAASSLRAVTDLACDKIITSFNLQQDVLYDQKFSQMAGPGLGMTRLVSIRGIPVQKWSNIKLRQLCQRLSIPGTFSPKNGKQKLCELIVAQAICDVPAPVSSHQSVTDLACEKIITSFNLQQDVVYDQKFSQMAGHGGMTRLVSIRGIPVQKWSNIKLRQLCRRLSIPGSFSPKNGKQKLCELIVEQAIWGGPASAVTDLACEKIVASFNLQQDVVYDQEFSQMAGPGLDMTRLVSIRGIPVQRCTNKMLVQLCRGLSIPGLKRQKQKLCELIVGEAIGLGVPSRTIRNQTSRAIITSPIATTKVALIGAGTQSTTIHNNSIAAAAVGGHAPSHPEVPTTTVDNHSGSVLAPNYDVAPTPVDKKAIIHGQSSLPPPTQLVGPFAIVNGKPPASTKGDGPLSPPVMSVCEPELVAGKVTTKLIASVDLRRDIVYDENNLLNVSGVGNSPNPMTRLVSIKGIHVFGWTRQELWKLCNRFSMGTSISAKTTKAKVCELIVTRAIYLGVPSTDTTVRTRQLYSNSSDVHGSTTSNKAENMTSHRPSRIMIQQSALPEQAFVPGPRPAPKKTKPTDEVIAGVDLHRDVVYDKDNPRGLRLTSIQGVHISKGYWGKVELQKLCSQNLIPVTASLLQGELCELVVDRAIALREARTDTSNAGQLHAGTSVSAATPTMMMHNHPDAIHRITTAAAPTTAVTNTAASTASVKIIGVPAEGFGQPQQIPTEQQPRRRQFQQVDQSNNYVLV